MRLEWLQSPTRNYKVQTQVWLDITSLDITSMGNAQVNSAFHPPTYKNQVPASTGDGEWHVTCKTVRYQTINGVHV